MKSRRFVGVVALLCVAMFRCAPSDNPYPTLVLQSFSVNENKIMFTQEVIDVPVDIVFAVQFSHALDTVGIKKKIRLVQREAYTDDVPLLLYFSYNTNTLSITLPKGVRLAFNTKYKLSLSGNMISNDGKHILGNDVLFHFKTATTTLKGILSFSFEQSKNLFLKKDYVGYIVNNDINVIMDAAVTNILIRSLRPTIAFVGREIQPRVDFPRDFTNTVTYVIIADDDSQVSYQVNISFDNISREAELFSFALPIDNRMVIGVLSSEHQVVTFSGIPFGTNLKALKPAASISPNSTISPSLNQAVDFSDDTRPNRYAVIAQDNVTANIYSIVIKYNPVDLISLSRSRNAVYQSDFASTGDMFKVTGLAKTASWSYTFSIGGRRSMGNLLTDENGEGLVPNPFSEDTWKFILDTTPGGVLIIDMTISIENVTPVKTFTFTHISIN